MRNMSKLSTEATLYPTKWPLHVDVIKNKKIMWYKNFCRVMLVFRGLVISRARAARQKFLKKIWIHRGAQHL